VEDNWAIGGRPEWDAPEIDIPWFYREGGVVGHTPNGDGILQDPHSKLSPRR
jgi:hypothetical protein